MSYFSWIHRQDLVVGRKPGYLSHYIFQVRLLQAGRGTKREGHLVAVAHNVLAGTLRKEGTLVGDRWGSQ